MSFELKEEEEFYSRDHEGLNMTQQGGGVGELQFIDDGRDEWEGVRVAPNRSVILDMLKRLTTDEQAALYHKLGMTSKDHDDVLIYLAESFDTESNPGGGGRGFITPTKYEQRLMRYTTFQAHRFLLLYIPPFLLVLGTLGNAASFLILRNKAMLKFSTYFYLMLMAVADTLVLYVGLLRLWIGELSGVDLRDRSDWICKLTNVVGYTVSDVAVWLIIVVTMERYLVVCHPFSASSLCNSVRARRVIIIILIIFTLLNLHFFWTVHVVVFKQDGGTSQCMAVEQHQQFIQDVWPWVDIITYSVLPFLLITSLNIMIIRQVLLARGERSRLRDGGTRGGARDGRGPSGSTVTTGGIGPGGGPVILPPGPPGVARKGFVRRRPSQEGSTRLTLMLLTISFAFLLTTLPMNIFNIAAKFWNAYRDDYERIARYRLLRTITELLMYSNHSMNFILYCATGQKFRHQLVWMFCYAKRTLRKRTPPAVTVAEVKGVMGLRRLRVGGVGLNGMDGGLRLSPDQVSCSPVAKLRHGSSSGSSGAAQKSIGAAVSCAGYKSRQRGSSCHRPSRLQTGDAMLQQRSCGGKCDVIALEDRSTICRTRTRSGAGPAVLAGEGGCMTAGGGMERGRGVRGAACTKQK